MIFEINKKFKELSPDSKFLRGKSAYQEYDKSIAFINRYYILINSIDLYYTYSMNFPLRKVTELFIYSLLNFYFLIFCAKSTRVKTRHPSVINWSMGFVRRK